LINIGQRAATVRERTNHTLQIVRARTCQYCCYAIEAIASSRTILICDHKEGAEAKFFVVAHNETCGNFKAAQTAPLPDTNGARLIPLTQGKFAIVDAEDYPRLAKYKWHCHEDKTTCYAARRKFNKIVSMHREIMQASPGQIVDHIDRNGLNNRKTNLRFCTPFQNACNRRPDRNTSSKYKGVTFHKRKNKWQAQIYCARKNNHLGYFHDEMEAAIAYDRKAEVLFGQFAYLNFPQLKEFRKHLKILFSA